MKKEKKRELTIKQLQKREDITNKISIYSAVGAICVSIVIVSILILVSLITGTTFSSYYVISKVTSIVFVFLLICVISLKFAKGYRSKIKVKNKENEISRIKKISSNGNIKEEIAIKSKMLENAILSNNIEKVIFREIKVGAVIPKDADCTIELYLKDGSLLQTIFSMEDFLKLINRASKARMLNHLIKSIKIENSEVTIDAENLNWKGKVTDDELIEMFELKE